jgi:hypothetical protein
MHYVNKESLRAEHQRQSAKKAAGVDKMTKEEYGKNLDQNLESLVERITLYA